jgi:HPt (histidine-containing phosphotransfer) domain-containing protein
LSIRWLESAINTYTGRLKESSKQCNVGIKGHDYSLVKDKKSFEFFYTEGETMVMNESLKSFIKSQESNKDYNSNLIMQLYEDTDDTTVLQILARFRETLIDSIQKMKPAAEAGDTDVIWKFAHKIAGSAELVGFGHLGRTARDLSHRLRDSQNPSAFSGEIKKFVELTKNHADVITTAFPNFKDYLT